MTFQYLIFFCFIFAGSTYAINCYKCGLKEQNKCDDNVVLDSLKVSCPETTTCVKTIGSFENITGKKFSIHLCTSARSNSLFIEFEFHQVSNCRVRTCIKLECCFSISNYGSSNLSLQNFFRAQVYPSLSIME